jgi:hypothetical protein
VWLPREDQLRAALGEAFAALRRREDGGHVVELRADGDRGSLGDDEGLRQHGVEGLREIAAPRAEDALAGALLVHLTRSPA